MVSFDSLGLLIRFWPFGPKFGPFWAKIGWCRPYKAKISNLYKNLYSLLENMWKSDLFWLSRPLDKVLDLWANFGPLRAKISKIGWGTPTFYWSPRLYLPIGIQNWPYFGWDISSHFLPWVKMSGETGVVGVQSVHKGSLRLLKVPKWVLYLFGIRQKAMSYFKIRLYFTFNDSLNVFYSLRANSNKMHFSYWFI